jgi:hypothetical protein
MGRSLPGEAGDKKTEIVTIVGSEGAMNIALDPGSTETILPSVTSQVTVVLGGMDPSSVSVNSLPASILHSSGRMECVSVGIATTLDGRLVENANKRARMRTAFRDIFILACYESV